MGSNYSWRALVDAPGTLPAGEAALWLRLLWMPAVGSMLVAVMLFPSGRPLSWRWGGRQVRGAASQLDARR